MKKPVPPVHERILWRNFKGTVAHRAMKRALRLFGYKLVLEFNEQKVAKDVYVIRTLPSHPVLVSGTDEAISHTFLKAAE